MFPVCITIAAALIWKHALPSCTLLARRLAMADSGLRESAVAAAIVAEVDVPDAADRGFRYIACVCM